MLMDSDALPLTVPRVTLKTQLDYSNARSLSHLHLHPPPPLLRLLLPPLPPPPLPQRHLPLLSPEIAPSMLTVLPPSTATYPELLPFVPSFEIVEELPICVQVDCKLSFTRVCVVCIRGEG